MTYPNDAEVSRQLYSSAINYMPGGNTRTTVFMSPFPIYAKRGQGCRVWDVDGVERIDCINNFTSMIHGYAHPAINAAVIDQLQYGTCFGMPTESEITLAKLLCERVKSVEKVRFTNSGTEAVMMALKAARAYSGREKIAKVEGSYHGSYDYAEVSLESVPDNWDSNGQPNSTAYAKGTPNGVLNDVVTLPFNQPELAEKIIRQHGSELAAILVDPLPNRAGLAPADKAYIETLARVAKDVGALLIFDEVITFRLAYHGAQEIWGVEADLTSFGKIIGGGFPIGAVGGRSDIMAVFDPSKGKPALPHGGTFSANPISMRAGLASMQLLDHAAFKRLDEIGDRVRSETNTLFKHFGIPGQALGMGSLLKIHFTAKSVTDYRSAFPTKEETRRLTVFNRGLLNRGVLSASYGLMALSTTMSDEDITLIISAIDGALFDVVASIE
jgi:glutamate-1-semialdehyde 2,1-aminomutase